MTRDGEIEITVSVPSHGRINCAPVARLGGLAPARPTMGQTFVISIYNVYDMVSPVIPG